MSRFTRRGALALLGALAGCSGANPLSSESDTTELDGAAVRAAVADSPPSVPHRLPVGVGTDHLDATERRARALLDAVPARLGSEEIPNGAIRERVRHAREHAAEDVSRAAEPSTRFERLNAFADARGEARFAAGAWRAIDEGLTRDDLADEAAGVRADRRALRERWSYVGDDPVDATLVHAAVERRLDTAGSRARVGEPTQYRAGNPLGVGEAAEDVERARVAVDDAGHLYDRLIASIDDPADLRSRLLDARESLRDDFESEREAVEVSDPDRPWQVEGADVEGTAAADALRDLYRPLRPDRGGPENDATVARSLLYAHGAFVALRAFESLRERVADGEEFALDSADDLTRVRTSAIEAIRSADESPRVPALTRSALADLTERMAWADADLADVEGSVRAASLRHEVSTYLVVAARARAVPRVSERVAEALRG